METDRHEKFMSRCLQLATAAKEGGNTPVGSVLVREGRIIAEAREGDNLLPVPMAHAEAVAIVKALSQIKEKDLSECVLYTTVEPCFMCAYLIRKTGIREVVFGMRTDGVGGYSSDYPFLVADNITKWSAIPVITEGILKDECGALFDK